MKKIILIALALTSMVSFACDCKVAKVKKPLVKKECTCAKCQTK